MKKILLLLMVFSSVLVRAATLSATKLTNYKKAGLVWGLLKYHHPEISKGAYNWDTQFITLFNSIEAIDNTTEAEEVLLAFIKKFPIKNSNTKQNTDQLNNPSYSWVTTTFTNKQLIASLTAIAQSNKIGHYYAEVSNGGFINFPNDVALPNFTVTTSSHRMLVLFKFWNVVQYYNVNKSLAHTNWLVSLNGFVNGFYNAKSQLTFEIEKCKLISTLADSHAANIPAIVLDSVFTYKPSFGVTYVNDSLVVNYLYNTPQCSKNNIRLGDVITSINGQLVSEAVISKVGPLVSASNFNFLCKYAYYALCGTSTTARLTIVRNNKEFTQQIALTATPELDKPQVLTSTHATVEKLQENVYYLNAEKLTTKQCDSFFKATNRIDNLIIDIRRNHNQELRLNHIANYLISGKKDYIKAKGPVKNSPATFNWLTGGVVGAFISPFTIKGGKNHVNKSIILLVNRNTQSRGEHFAVGLQQADDCITLGEQTAGSVMNITTITLPDGSTIPFTSLQGFYPNTNQCIQQNGVLVTNKVIRSARNYNPDDYIVAALKIINEQGM